jgi:hypothetical protein
MNTRDVKETRPFTDVEPRLEKRIVWILEWLEPWDGGKGEVFKHRVFQSEKKAVRVGQTMLAARLTAAGDPLYYIERMMKTLEQRNLEGNHYVLGIFIKPAELE